MNILIVDDNPLNLKLLCAQLEGEGHTIVEAHDGIQALEILHRRRADVTITDVLMPHMDGYRLCHAIRNSKHLHTMPVIIYTATYTSASDEKLAMEVGANLYLKKPASVTALTAALRDVCSMTHVPAQTEPIGELQVLKEYSQRLVTKLEERNRELTQANQALMRSNEELQQFAYITSHDLQTPLRSISGFVQLLESNYADALDDQARDWIRRTVQSVNHMHTMIQDVLAYSKVDSEILPFQQTPFREIFDDAVTLLDDGIRQAGAQATCGELPTIMGNRSALVRLMQNLIGNGLKYHGKEPPHVHITAQSGKNEWVFSVRDNGIGIDPKYHKRIFEIFRRLHTPQEYPGTGIGLAICRRVIDSHAGRIWVESQLGHGSTFYFTIPQRSVDQI